MTPAARIRVRLVGRLHPDWRAPMLGALTSRPWPAIFAGVGAVLVSLPIGVRSAAWLKIVAFYGVLALALSLTHGMIASDRTLGRWTFFFQRPVAPRAHYAREATVSLAFLVGVIVLFWSMQVALLRHDWTARSLVSVLVMALLWGILSFASSLCTSSLVRRGDTVLALLWAAMPVVAAIVLNGLGTGQWAQSVVELLCPPVNAVFGLQSRMVNPDVAFERRWAVQLIVFPLWCLGLTWWRLGRLGSGGPRDRA